MDDEAAPLPAPLSGLLRPEAFPHPVGEVRCVQTHLSWVLLAGDYAYKIKRPVRYPFVDFTDRAVRERMCREELRLNARFAPQLYLSVEPVCVEAGAARIGGPGKAIEWAVRMRRFDRRAELDRLVVAGEVSVAELAAFGAALAARHDTLPVDEQSAACEVVERTGRSLQANLRETQASLDAVGVQLPDVGVAGALDRRFMASIGALSRRALSGRVRECHGDLHLSNIVRLGGELVAFDCLEFDPALRWLDVADDAAFLWADLVAYGRADLARAFLQGYADGSGDFDMLDVLDLFVAHRALVRAKVMAIRAAQFVGDSSPRAALLARCRGYVTVASEALAPRRAVLVLVGGVSGSGKSWLAARLAAGLDGLHLRSDLERKRLAGLATTAGSGSPLGGGLYSAEWNARTYDRLLRAAGNVLASGRIAIVDATFLEASQRDPFRALAAERGVACHHIECTAPEAVLRERILRRRAEGGDPSEADLAVLERQLARRDMPGQGADAPLVVIDTAAADTVQRALAALLSRNGRG
jgi:aminoglycoside phosphotransferase family enzyme/predicted kinase